jgi:hypothetical protein
MESTIGCAPPFCTGNIQATGVNDDFLLVEALFCSVRSMQSARNGSPVLVLAAAFYRLQT